MGFTHFVFGFAFAFGSFAFGEIRSLNFDFDDNIFVTDAKSRLWDTANSTEIEFSTAVWALTREKVGKPGPFEKMTIRPDGFRDFEDSGSSGTQLFNEQITRALQTEGWKGPVWDAFVRSVGNAATCPYTTIITARRHDPASVASGLETLKAKGWLPHVLPASQIYVVGWPGLPAKYSAPTLPERKAKVMLDLLDGVDAHPIPPKAKTKQHLWGFSDDDYGNFETARSTLAKEVAAKRWPKTKVLLAYTGTNNPEQKPRCEVLQASGKPRPCTDLEKTESFKAN